MLMFFSFFNNCKILFFIKSGPLQEKSQNK